MRPRSEQEESEQEISRDGVTVENYLTDWDPVLSRMRPHRILESREDAESGEEFFMLSPTHGYRRHYRPTYSERDEEAGTEMMDVDEGPAREVRETMVREEGTVLPDDDYLWEDYDRNEPPEALDWTKLENCIRYMSEEEERRT